MRENSAPLAELDTLDRNTKLALCHSACLMLAADSSLSPNDAIGDAYQVYKAVFMDRMEMEAGRGDKSP